MNCNIMGESIQFGSAHYVGGKKLDKQIKDLCDEVLTIFYSVEHAYSCFIYSPESDNSFPNSFRRFCMLESKFGILWCKNFIYNRLQASILQKLSQLIQYSWVHII